MALNYEIIVDTGCARLQRFSSLLIVPGSFRDHSDAVQLDGKTPGLSIEYPIAGENISFLGW